MSLKTRYITLLTAALAGLFVLSVALTTCNSPFGFGDAIDFEAPKLSIDEGRNPRYVKRNFTLQGDVTDNIAVDRIEVQHAVAEEEKEFKFKTRFPVTITGTRWRVDMVFTEYEDGKRFPIEVVAYDHAGNSGPESIGAISLIVDISDPVVDELWIQRTDRRRAYLESIRDLRALETSDALGFTGANVERYQNGRFWIDARLSEGQTRIDKVKLQLYDTRYPDTPLFEDDDEEATEEALFDGRVRDQGRTLQDYNRDDRGSTSTVTAPRWTVTEDEILAAGERIWPNSGYAANYRNGQRYYYQVVILSHDSSQNQGRWRFEEQSYFAMWEKGDEPKAVLDSLVVGSGWDIQITKGDILPVEFFDDDVLDWGVADLFSKAQWEGNAPINNSAGDSLRLPIGNDQFKLNWLKEQLVDNGRTDIANWAKDKRYLSSSPSGSVSWADFTLSKRFGAGTTAGPAGDEKTVFIQTGTTDDDYGEFVLFTLVKDNKLDPHDNTGPENTNRERWVGRLYNVQIIDDNQPLIVIDTMDVSPTIPGSPESNTFPRLTNGRYFTIRGYTLRQAGETDNGFVNYLRLAWIPFGTSGNVQSGMSSEVLENLKNGTFDGSATGTSIALSANGASSIDPATGVQYWKLKLLETNPHGTTAGDVVANGKTYVSFGANNTRYRKQFFEKTFDLLGGSAASTSGILLANSIDENHPTGKLLKNATADPLKVNEQQFVNLAGELENELKLFKFLAIDSILHDVDLELKILGRITPPKLTIYDLSNRITPAGAEPPPDINAFAASHGGGLINEAARNAYQTALIEFNDPRKKNPPEAETANTPFTVTQTLANELIAAEKIQDYEAQPLRIFPRNKLLRYWANAEEAGDLGIVNIEVKDSTFGSSAQALGSFQTLLDGTGRLSFVESLPEVVSRDFQFTATDTLGNEMLVKRTVIVTSTSMLTDITSSRPNATYGISETEADAIVIRAVFSSQVRWTGTTPPLLNVRYIKDGNNVLRQIPTTTPRETAVGELEFKFIVPEGATKDGQLQTMFDAVDADLSLTNVLSTTETHTVTTTGTASNQLSFTPTTGSPRGDYNRPITLVGNTRIMDVSRGIVEEVPAFVPGYSFDGNGMDLWTDAPARSLYNRSLQITKDIKLDGIRPYLVPADGSYYIKVGGKALDDGRYYFKGNETITFTLKTNTAVQPSGGGKPSIQFYVHTGNTNSYAGTAPNLRLGPYNAIYDTASDSGTTLLFSFPVNNTVTGDGAIITAAAGDNAISLNTATGGLASEKIGNAIRMQQTGGDVVRPSATYAIPAPLDPATHIHLDQTPPPAPWTRMINNNGTQMSRFRSARGSQAAVNIARETFRENLRVFVEDALNDDGTDPERNGGVTKEISIDGSWTRFAPGVEAVLPASPDILENGVHNIQTRYVDRAGNQSVLTTKTVDINAEFPKLLGISSVESNGTHNRGKSLRFRLDFADTVTINTAGAATTLRITLADTITTANNPNGTNPSYSITLNRTNATASGSTVTFTWTSVNGKDMLDGLKITELDISALRDSYGNAGPATVNAAASGTITLPVQTGVTTAYNVSYNLSGIIVSGIAPVVRTYEPQNALNRTGDITAYSANNGLTNGIAAENNTVATGSISVDNSKIRITFSKPMAKGSRGTITVKPRGQYLIPPVFENGNYYIDQNGNRSSSPGTGRTVVTGMSDIFNKVNASNIPVADRTTHRTALIGGTNLSSPPLDGRTGQTAGPYIRMTHGLRSGMGFTGNYSGTNANGTGNPNGPHFTNATNTNSMVPDTTAKWVLDYRYSINNSTNTRYTNTSGTVTAASNTAVTDIRSALTAAKFRWQEFDVTSSNVVITTRTVGAGAAAVTYGVVTITLPEPLLKGLQWDLCYPEGTFTDVAANVAPALNYTGTTIAGQDANSSAYWFWSNGVQTPVIRVNRKSYDARTSNWSSTTRTYNNPANETTYPSAGWGIGNFNTVHYRIETETPNARLYYATRNGREETGASSIIIGSAYVEANTAQDRDWNIAVPNGGTAVNTVARNWTTNSYDNTGEWVRPNLIRRSQNNTGSWSAFENGVSTTRNFQGAHRGFRSYNTDVLITTLNGLTLSETVEASVSGGEDLSFSYYPTEASKNYVVAQARVNHNNANWNGAAGFISEKGYEGVFRSVIALYQGSNADRTILVEGSNIKNGMPSIAGFPVRDAEESGDNRFIKVFYRGMVSNTNNRQYLWVSTEIVSQWYFIKYGGTGAGATHMSSGEVNNYLTAGYGDLTFAYHSTSYND